MSSHPEITRIRHELKRRTLTVTHTKRLTPVMIRITLNGEEMADFVSAGADDHIKIAVPGAGEELERRDYTPRRFDTKARELVIDFADHDGGPATDWARNVRVGDTLVVGGPRGSQVIGGDIRHWVLVGDETALPAIGRRLEELPAGVTATCIIAVPCAADQQRFETRATVNIHWVHRAAQHAADASPLLDQLRQMPLEARTFVWIAAEATVAKALRTYLLDERRFPKEWLKASGYWVKGQADAAIKSFDEA